LYLSRFTNRKIAEYEQEQEPIIHLKKNALMQNWKEKIHGAVSPPKNKITNGPNVPESDST